MTTPTNNTIQKLAADARKVINSTLEAVGLRQLAASVAGKEGKQLAEAAVKGIAPTILGPVYTLINERPNLSRVRLEVSIDLPERGQGETDAEYDHRLKVALMMGVSEQAKQLGIKGEMGIKASDYDRTAYGAEAAGVSVKLSLTERVAGAKPRTSSALVGSDAAAKAVSQLLKDDRDRYGDKTVNSVSTAKKAAEIEAAMRMALDPDFVPRYQDPAVLEYLHQESLRYAPENRVHFDEWLFAEEGQDMADALKEYAEAKAQEAAPQEEAPKEEAAPKAAPKAKAGKAPKADAQEAAY